jgi:hypothetical protein
MPCWRLPASGAAIRPAAARRHAKDRLAEPVERREETERRRVMMG